MLNLAGIPSLRSSDLIGLMPTDAIHDLSVIEMLILNNTGIDDDVAPYIASCPLLRTLEVAGTRVTSMS